MYRADSSSLASTGYLPPATYHSPAEPHRDPDLEGWRAMRAWRVIHACETTERIANIAEVQRSAGMRPVVVTPDGPVPIERLTAVDGSPSRASLLHAWQNVRQWRRVLMDADPMSASDLVHAHSFSCGMAAVRNCPTVVYELHTFVEDLAPRDEAAAESATWLWRSFRVAEQFVLTRAAAIVVPYQSVRQGVIERGAGPEHIFVVPEALDLEPSKQVFAEADATGPITFFAPDLCAGVDGSNAPTPELESLLHAFAGARRSCHGVALVLNAPEEARTAIQSRITAIGLNDCVALVSQKDCLSAAAEAQVIIATGNSGHGTALNAFLHTKVLVAADVAQNRDISPDGQGCLWFRSDDPLELARQMTFVASNPDLRRSLVHAGRQHLEQTRSAAVVAVKYDQVYRHAIARRRTGNLQTPAAQLQPLAA